MPLPPFVPNESAAAGVWRFAWRLPVLLFLGGTLMAGNAVQMLSLALLPFSGAAFRGVNRWVAGLWWGWCVALAERINGCRVTVTGDPLPNGENAILVVNHQQMADIPLVLALAKPRGRIGDLKWFVKAPLKWVPGIGWGMLFLDCVFVERDWTRDRTTVERTFHRLNAHETPMWLVAFAEGTRVTAAKIARSQEYARKEGLKPLEHLLLPRPRGFAAAVTGLRNHATAVYDVTIGYVGGVPTLWQYALGHSPRQHLHVRRTPLSALPESEEGLRDWLYGCFQEKDALLAQFYANGAFPSGASSARGTHAGGESERDA